MNMNKAIVSRLCLYKENQNQDFRTRDQGQAIQKQDWRFQPLMAKNSYNNNNNKISK